MPSSTLANYEACHQDDVGIVPYKSLIGSRKYRRIAAPVTCGIQKNRQTSVWCFQCPHPPAAAGTFPGGQKKASYFRRRFRVLALPIFPGRPTYCPADETLRWSVSGRIHINKKEPAYWLVPLVMLALPIFPGSRPPSIVGVHELNFCVRDGNRWTLMTINTNYFRWLFTILMSNDFRHLTTFGF